MSSFIGIIVIIIIIIIIIIISMKVLTDCPVYAVKELKLDTFCSIFGIRFLFIIRI